MDTTNLLFLVGAALAIGIILRPEVALTALGALTLIGSPLIIAASPYGIIAAVPVLLVGAVLIGFGDMVKHSRAGEAARSRQHDELMRFLRRRGESPPLERAEGRGRLTQTPGGH